jgi:thiol-disulfide isomerase/thioredoxin
MNPGPAVAVALALGLAAAPATAPPAAPAAGSPFVPWRDAPPSAHTLKGLDGRVTTLADYHGKVLLVSFWASWCTFCKEQMAAMQKLRLELADQPFEILAVNFAESPARVREYVRSLAVDLPVILDPNQDVARAWRVRVLPVTFVVGADGQPRYSVLGEYDWASTEAVDTIRALLP